MVDKALGAYLGMACGDALGATVEFMSAKSIQQKFGVHKDIIGGGWLALQAGYVTDDTQMSLAIGRSIINRQGWNAQDVADEFVRWLETDPVDIGNTCRRGILRYRDQGELFGAAREDDAGNGACMRNLPVVLATLNNDENLQKWSMQQCHITHHHRWSDAATLALGRMTAHLIKGEHAQALEVKQQFLSDYPEFNYHPYPGKSSPFIIDTLQTVLYFFETRTKFESCLVATVNQGGDADTTGALSGMLAGAKYGMAAIPERWIQALDQQVTDTIKQQTMSLISQEWEEQQSIENE